MAHGCHAEFNQVFSRELPQSLGIDIVLAERSFVLFEPQTV
jgi:hypothetical protein